MARKSKVEELGLVVKKKALFRRLPKFGAKSTEADVMRFLQVVIEGKLSGLLTLTEAAELRADAAVQLRALRQLHAHKDVPDLEGLLVRVEAFEKRQSKRGATERDSTR